MLFLLKFITLAVIIAKHMEVITVSWWVALIPLYLLVAMYSCVLLLIFLFIRWYVNNHPDKQQAHDNINELKKLSLDKKLTKEQKNQLSYSILAIGFPDDKMKFLRGNK
jgi:membrane protein implicated in regulation of membrane protease activity